EARERWDLDEVGAGPVARPVPSVPDLRWVRNALDELLTRGDRFGGSALDGRGGNAGHLTVVEDREGPRVDELPLLLGAAVVDDGLPEPLPEDDLGAALALPDVPTVVVDL